MECSWSRNIPVKQFIAKTTFQVDEFFATAMHYYLLFLSRMIWFENLSWPFKSQSSISPFYVIFHLFFLSFCGEEVQSKNHKDFCVRKNLNVPMAWCIEIPILMLTLLLMLILHWRECWWYVGDCLASASHVRQQPVLGWKLDQPSFLGPVELCHKSES